MGKKKVAKATPKTETKEQSKTIENTLVSKFGDCFVSGQYLASQPRIVVPVSPMLDSILNGGVPFGSFVIPTGRPKLGKTSFALNMAANALKIPTEFEEPRKLYIFNIEGRINPRDLAGIHHMKEHLDNDQVEIITSKPGNIKKAEDFLEIGEALINHKPGSIFVFDSFSQLCSQEGYDHEWSGKQYRDNVPKFLSQFCKRICNVIPINKSIVVGITHLIADTGISFSSWAEASGNKVQYAVDVKLKATHCTPWMVGETKIGQNVNWECFCSPLHNGPTVTKCVSKLRYGYGIDKEAELVEIGADIGAITKGGSWYTFTDGSKVQGLDNAAELLRNNPDLYNQINTQYRGIMDY